ncbi:MAG: DUF484 family protein [Nitrospinae bacterium]|nr:DUF484 family protein [Nitrospinota bacterium]MZH46488.1 DUF484 family protein [Nitrospinota bacterium]
MNKDQVAIYLNEHPEFFNEYPELLKKIKEIKEEDLPIEPMSTLSLADRIIKRVHDDKEHLKSKLEWLFEISRANEKIQDHLFEIERLVLTSTNLDQMVHQLQKEIPNRFGIPSIKVCLIKGADPCVESRLRQRYNGTLDETVKFITQETVDRWFEQGIKPVLRSEIEESEMFGNNNETVKSEAIIPIVAQDSMVGAIAFGSPNPFHFHDGLGSDFLERMADKVAISINNILLIDQLKDQLVVNPV